MHPLREIRAAWDARTITVYQAYGHAIADAALAAQRLVAPFSYERMTWVKPSFLWMMERCGWATRPLQERVLAIRIGRAHFERALALAVPTEQGSHASAARVQWDPERDVRGKKLIHRSLQLGLGRPLCRDYASAWIEGIEDLTPLVKRLHALRREGEFERLERGLPEEHPYPLEQ
jgi:hypothetical protein